MISGMIICLFISQYINLSLDKRYSANVSLKIYHIVNAIYTIFVYISIYIFWDKLFKVDLESKISYLFGRIVSISFSILALCALCIIYFKGITVQEFNLDTVYSLLLIGVNSILLCFLFGHLSKLSDYGDEEYFDKNKYIPQGNFMEVLTDYRYYILLIGTFVVIGSGHTFETEAESIAVSSRQPHIRDNISKFFWMSAIEAALITGLISSILENQIILWLLGVLAAFSGIIGLILILLTNSYGVFSLLFSSILIGAATGGWWIIAPLIILQEFGKNTIGISWGLVMLVNVCGYFLFERLFYWISQKIELSRSSECKGISCLLLPLIASVLVAGFLWMILKKVNR